MTFRSPDTGKPGSKSNPHVIRLKGFIYAHPTYVFSWPNASLFVDYAINQCATSDWFTLVTFLQEKDLPFVVPSHLFNEMYAKFNELLPKAVEQRIRERSIISISGWHGLTVTDGESDTVFKRLLVENDK